MRCPSISCGTLNRMSASNAIDYAKHRSRSHDAVIRVYDRTGNVIETDGRGPGIDGSKNVIKMSLLSTFKRLEDKLLCRPSVMTRTALS